MKADEILQKSLDTLKQRGQENGYDKKEERSAADIARRFARATGKTLSEAEVWLFLVALKEARLARQLANGADPSDTLIDLVAYTALYAESAHEAKL